MFNSSNWLRQAHYTSRFLGRVTAKRGQSITEYGLIGVLIIVVSIGAITLFGKNLTGVFNKVSNKADSQSIMSFIQPKSGAEASGSGSTPGLNGSPGGMASNGAAAGQTSNQQNITQTAGVNGGTEKASQDLIKIAQQTLAAGQIDQNQADLFMQVANQGHEMAVMESLMQNAYHQANGDKSTYDATPITYNGQTYTPAQITSQLSDASDNLAVLTGRLGSALKGAPNVMTLMTTVTQASNTIHNIAATHISAPGNLGGITLDEVYGSTSNAATATNQNSATICTAGQHLDVNNQCVN